MVTDLPESAVVPLLRVAVKVTVWPTKDVVVDAVRVVVVSVAAATFVVAATAVNTESDKTRAIRMAVDFTRFLNLYHLQRGLLHHRYPVAKLRINTRFSIKFGVDLRRRGGITTLSITETRY
jgi:hypothetical protein